MASDCGHPERYGEKNRDICMGCGEMRVSGRVVGTVTPPRTYSEASFSLWALKLHQEGA